MKKKYGTNYRVAVEWLNNSLILCNNITVIDSTVYNNLRFSIDDEGEYLEVYQWFLTDCTDDDVDYLEEHFGLKFTYSELLETYVLCVDHYGTSWDYVYCDTDLECAKRELGEPRLRK
jgi:hypothetical protein